LAPIISLNLPKEKINAVLQKDISMAAKRPPDVTMDSSKTYKFGYEPEKTTLGLKSNER